VRFFVLSILLFLSLLGCQGSIGIRGDNNDDNQVVVGDNNQVISDNGTTTNITTVNRINSSRLPPPPPDIEDAHNGYRPIISLSTGEFEKDNSGCESRGNKIVTVAKDPEEANSGNLAILLQGEDQVRNKYYLATPNLGNARSSWLSTIFVPGRRLKIGYYVCGNGALAHLTYVEPLRASE
jgi:hypothetical protein